MNLNKSNILIFLGPPGSGKGTLAKLCVNRLDWTQFSTGDLLREHIFNKTDLGQKIDFIIKSGKLISDTLIIEIVENKLLKELGTKPVVILDGFPRTENQAIALNKMLKSSCLSNTDLTVIKLEISDANIISRLLNRVVCQNQECSAVYTLNNELSLSPAQENICSLCSSNLAKRVDDELTVITDRLKLYHQYEPGILEVFKKSGIKIISLDSDKPIETVYKDLITTLDI